MSIKNLTGWYPLQMPYGGDGGGGGIPSIPSPIRGRAREAMESDNGNGALVKLDFTLSPYIGQGSKEQLYSITQRLDAGAADNDLIELFSASTTKGQGVMQTAKAIGFANVGVSPVALSIKIPLYSADVTAGTSHYLQTILPVGETLVLPTTRLINSNDKELDDGTVVAMVAPNSNEYVDSAANTDDTTGTDNVDNSATNTTVYTEPHTSATNCTANMFRVGDYIRIRDEIMEVTAIGDKSNLANNTLTVKRGVAGSTATTNTDDDDPVRLPFFNMYHEFDDTSYNGGGNGSATLVKTNVMGKFKATNFFGYGRSTIFVASGLLPGSISIKFYTSGYQELGISGATPNSSSSLSKSTTYYYKLAVDAGTSTEITFVTDASNVNWGGSNGVLQKINDAIASLNDTAGSTLLDRKCTATIVNGDIRFTSNSHLSTSAVALATSIAGDSGVNELFDLTNRIGKIPAAPKAAVAAKLPNETKFDIYTNEEVSDNNAFMYDDGAGNLIWRGSQVGTINYDTGAISFVGPANAEFEIAVSHGSNLSGRVNVSGGNTIEEVSARSVNPKINGLIHMKVIG